MLASTFKANTPLVINGQARIIVKQDVVHGQLKAAGVTLLGRGDMARVKSGQGSIILRAVRIVIRASGRSYRHLARYLVGVTQEGVQWEIFLGVVQGIRNALFRARLWGQSSLLKLSAALLGSGLGMKQRLEAMGW